MSVRGFGVKTPWDSIYWSFWPRYRHATTRDDERFTARKNEIPESAIQGQLLKELQGKSRSPLVCVSRK